MKLFGISKEKLEAIHDMWDIKNITTRDLLDCLEPIEHLQPEPLQVDERYSETSSLEELGGTKTVFVADKQVLRNLATATAALEKITTYENGTNEICKEEIEIKMIARTALLAIQGEEKPQPECVDCAKKWVDSKLTELLAKSESLTTAKEVRHLIKEMLLN